MADWKTFEHTDTETLISYYQEANNDSTLKDNAFLALCFRFREDLLKKCEIICKKRGHSEDVAYEICDATFKKYGKTCGFKLDKGKYSSFDLCFLVYLYKIARNELINYYNLNLKKEKGLLYDGTEGIITMFDIDSSNLSEENKIVHDTLTSLPYSHQVVYLTYKTHERDGVNLPKKLRMDLRKHLGGISQSTVRSYKKEAIDKIENTKQIIKKIKS